jgi:hypothetical protein
MGEGTGTGGSRPEDRSTENASQDTQDPEGAVRSANSIAWECGQRGRRSLGGEGLRWLGKSAVLENGIGNEIQKLEPN